MSAKRQPQATDAESDEEFWLDQYKKAGKWVIFWQLSARDLVCAANVLYRRYRSIPWETRKRCPVTAEVFHTSISIILMLYALALENLLKGLLVAKGMDGTSTGRLNKELQHHRLRDLCKDGGLTTSPDEDALLDQLQRLIESAKYPFGVRPRSADAHRGIMLPTDVDRTFLLIERVEAALRAAAPEETLERIDLKSLCIGEEGTS
jgi:hypothetical protein